MKICGKCKKFGKCGESYSNLSCYAEYCEKFESGKITNKEIKINIIPLIDMKEKKLDCYAIEEALIDDYGKGTKLYDEFNFSYFSAIFPEKNLRQVYEKSFELGVWFENYRYIVGQQGLFLAIEDTFYSTVAEIINKSKEFVSFCENYLFIPIGVAHISDGDFYLNDKDNIHRYRDVEIYSITKKVR